MKIFRTGIFAGILALAFSVHSESARAQFSNCAWPIEFSPEGYGNFLGPDDQARYWLLPFDKQYDTIVIKGFYPNARYFSFAVYNGDASGRPVSLAGHKYDSIIAPDAGSVNPFGQSSASLSPIAGSTDRAYTLCVARRESNPKNCPNTIQNRIDAVGKDALAWVALRLYVPSADKSLGGQALMGGQPLPAITLLEPNGSAQALQACPLSQDAPMQPDPTTHYYVDKSVNKLSDIGELIKLFFPAPFDIYTPRDYYEAAGDRLWFAPPKEPPILLLPNPDNKYIVMQPGAYQPGRIVVIRAKAPSFLDAYSGSPRPSSGSRSPDMRFWSICSHDFALPVSTVRCMDDQMAITQGGYFTIVVSDDLLRPKWLNPNINWLPWGDEQYPKLIFFRHMIPVARNDANYTADEVPPFSIQWVVKGCPGKCDHPDAVIDFLLPYVPTHAAINAAGPSAQALMGDYYPVALWCDKSAFEQGGWQSCAKR